MSARASILSWAGSLEQPWKGATSEQGHCAPTAAADSLGRSPVTLHAKKKKNTNTNFKDNNNKISILLKKTHRNEKYP